MSRRWNIDELRKRYAEDVRDFEPAAFASDEIIKFAEEVIEEAKEAVDPFLKGELWEAIRDISLNLLLGEDPGWLSEYPKDQVVSIATGIVRATEELLTTKEFVKSKTEE